MNMISYLKPICIGVAAALSLAPATAWADNVAHCEALIMKIVPDETGTGEAQIASYRPAVHFLASLYDEEEGHLDHMSGFPIRAIMCRRNDVIPSETDYPILATGLPFILSQDFDRPDTDSLTMFWKDGAIDYVYKGYPLSAESQAILDNRLASFSERGLTVPETHDEPEAKSETIEETPLDILAESEAIFEPVTEPTTETETFILDETASFGSEAVMAPLEIESEE